jgi:hypothetical protein
MHVPTGPAGLTGSASSALVTAGVALLWIPGLFCVVATAIMVIVGTRLRRRGLVADRATELSCAQVRPGGGLVQLAGASAAGPHGLVTGPVSGRECVWYRDRIYRIYDTARWQEGANGWEQVPAKALEPVWERQSGPFALRDDTGAVLVDPVLVDRRTTLDYPKEDALDVSQEDGPRRGAYLHGPVGTLLAAGLLPAGLLERFAAPEAGTRGYRVTEEIIRPGVPFQLCAVAQYRDGQPPGQPSDQLNGQPLDQANGQPVMMPAGDIPAISAGRMGTVLMRGGRSARWLATCLGVAGLGFFVLSGLLLALRGR